AALARSLSVAHLVSGTVQQGGGKLRVTVELTRAASGTRVWGQSYERPATDLMGVEAEIAQAIAEGVGGRLAPAERRSLAIRPSRNPEAYDHYLRGNYFLARRTAGDTRFAIDQYQKAVALDSSFTAALARIGYGYALYLDWGWTYPGLPRDSILRRGFAVADQALALDSNAADVWMTRGYLLGFSNPRTLSGVDAAFERAIALDPRNAEAYHQYGYLLLLAGRDSVAAAMLQRALALEPERPITFVTLAYLRHLERRDAEARGLSDSAVALVPDAAWAYARRSLWRSRSDTAGALADARTAVRLAPLDYTIEADAALAMAEFRSGDTTDARARLARIGASFSGGGSQATYFVSVAFATTGDTDGAIAVLRRMTPQGAFLWRLTQDPWFDGIRTDPRFRALVDESRPPNPED
ncbi:MAG TPA: tetratricopeptide repeat protein, partial [Gemmatimonadales bacterium]|nr:tetratricopeptide repeat protein [Gemmatimonadales bacterium]